MTNPVLPHDGFRELEPHSAEILSIVNRDIGEKPNYRFTDPETVTCHLVANVDGEDYVATFSDRPTPKEKIDYKLFQIDDADYYAVETEQSQSHLRQAHKWRNRKFRQFYEGYVSVTSRDAFHAHEGLSRYGLVGYDLRLGEQGILQSGSGLEDPELFLRVIASAKPEAENVIYSHSSFTGREYEKLRALHGPMFESLDTIMDKVGSSPEAAIHDYVDDLEFHDAPAAPGVALGLQIAAYHPDREKNDSQYAAFVTEEHGHLLAVRFPNGRYSITHEMPTDDGKWKLGSYSEASAVQTRILVRRPERKDFLLSEYNYRHLTTLDAGEVMDLNQVIHDCLKQTQE